MCPCVSGHAWGKWEDEHSRKRAQQHMMTQRGKNRSLEWIQGDSLEVIARAHARDYYWTKLWEYRWRKVNGLYRNWEVKGEHSRFCSWVTLWREVPFSEMENTRKDLQKQNWSLKSKLWIYTYTYKLYFFGKQSYRKIVCKNKQYLNVKIKGVSISTYHQSL